MYIPKHYETPNRADAIRFMQNHPFALLVSTLNGLPEATHLPFVSVAKGDKILLRSHLARANPHAGLLSEGEHLVVFSEPHAYISPDHYQKKENVPTWNYLAVHAYGPVQIIEEEGEKFQLLEEMMDQYEPAYKNQWKELPADFRSRMGRGIVAFEMEVNRLDAKEKLSQNKKPEEIKSIINTLSDSPDSTEKQLAEYMRKRHSD